MKVIVIGAVAAGMSAASKIKRLDNRINIKVFEKGTDVSYGACGLPYFLSDLISEEKKLIAKTVEDFNDAGIPIKLKHEVIEVLADEKVVIVKNLDDDTTSKHTYDKLIVATGASPIRLPIDGHDLSNIHTLNSLEDGRNLKKALNKAKTIAIIGGGYIGLEVAENLILMDKEVIIVERESHLLPQFDAFVGEAAKDALEKAGVKVLLNESIEKYLGENKVEKIVTDKGTYPIDLSIEAVGIKPSTAFLEGVLDRQKNGAIIVNEKMETSTPDIYAAGDCVSYPHHLLKENQFVALGTHANKAGRVIAEQIAGNTQTFDPILGSTVIKVADLEIAKTGLGEIDAKRHNINYKMVEVTARDKAGYYPNPTKIQMKLLYNPDNCQLLGALMVGKQGVAHRINTIAVAIKNNLTAAEFASIDFAYAPPFSPVYDPLQRAAMQIKCPLKNKGGDHE